MLPVGVGKNIGKARLTRNSQACAVWVAAIKKLQMDRICIAHPDRREWIIPTCHFHNMQYGAEYDLKDIKIVRSEQYKVVPLASYEDNEEWVKEFQEQFGTKPSFF